MRLSTQSIYNLGMGSMLNQYSDTLKLQQQLAAGKRVLSPSDDPIAAAQAIDAQSADGVEQQFIRNINAASSKLNNEDTILGQVTGIYQDIRASLVQAGSGSLSVADRNSVAADLKNQYNELLGVLNSKDSNGQYIFAGFQQSTQPFVESAPGSITYAGDQGTAAIQVGSARRVPTNDPGTSLITPGGANDMFAAINSLVSTMTSGAAQSAVAMSVKAQLQVLDKAEASIMSVRSSVGARMRELDAYANTADFNSTQHKTTLSALQDLDYAKAVSDLSRLQTGLDASQKSFAKLQSLNLFNYVQVG